MGKSDLNWYSPIFKIRSSDCISDFIYVFVYSKRISDRKSSDLEQWPWPLWPIFWLFKSALLTKVENFELNYTLTIRIYYIYIHHSTLEWFWKIQWPWPMTLTYKDQSSFIFWRMGTEKVYSIVLWNICSLIWQCLGFIWIKKNLTLSDDLDLQAHKVTDAIFSHNSKTAR